MDTFDDEASRADAIRVRLDELVDEASRQSFPASDAPAIHFDEGALVWPAPIADALGLVGSRCSTAVPPTVQLIESRQAREVR